MKPLFRLFLFCASAALAAAQISGTDYVVRTTSSTTGGGGGYTTLNAIGAVLPVSSAQQTALDAKQATLISGTTIKTINGASILGSGDLVVSGGAVGWADVTGKPAFGTAALTATTDYATAAQGATAGTALQPNGSAANLTNFPTFNQNTTGSAAKLTTARNINGVAFDGTANVTVTANLAAAGGGYTSGAGGTVTQQTNKTTGVTLNKICGQITMNGAALAAAAEVAFTLTNNTIAATDVVVVNIQSVGTAGAYFVTVGAVANGSCSITVGNCSAGSLSQALVLNFVVIKSVSA